MGQQLGVFCLSGERGRAREWAFPAALGGTWPTEGDPGWAGETLGFSSHQGPWLEAKVGRGGLRFVVVGALTERRRARGRGRVQECDQRPQQLRAVPLSSSTSRRPGRAHRESAAPSCARPPQVAPGPGGRPAGSVLLWSRVAVPLPRSREGVRAVPTLGRALQAARLGTGPQPAPLPAGSP